MPSINLFRISYNREIKGNGLNNVTNQHDIWDI